MSNYDSLGYALAMRVLQSDLYRQLDDTERGECDELARRGQRPSEKEFTLPFGTKVTLPMAPAPSEKNGESTYRPMLRQDQSAAAHWYYWRQRILAVPDHLFPKWSAFYHLREAMRAWPEEAPNTAAPVIEAPVSARPAITDNDKSWRFLEHGCQWVSWCPIGGEPVSFDPRDMDQLKAMRRKVLETTEAHLKLLLDLMREHGGVPRGAVDGAAKREGQDG